MLQSQFLLTLPSHECCRSSFSDLSNELLVIFNSRPELEVILLDFSAMVKFCQRMIVLGNTDFFLQSS
jgi:hypothetical protein